MCLEGYTVTHKAFGEGRVLSANDHYITVRFAETDKTFVYPDAFKSFMTIADEEAMMAIRADLQHADEETARREESRRREREMQRGKGVVLSGYRTQVEDNSSYQPSEDMAD